MAITPPFSVPKGTPPQDVRDASRADIAKRLKNACSHWTEEDFQHMVDQMTDVAMKYLPEKRKD